LGLEIEEARPGTVAVERGRKPEAALRLVLRPGLLAAFAFEHANSASIQRIEHGPSQRGLLAATTARPDWIGLVDGKHFVFELVAHDPRRRGRLTRYKVPSVPDAVKMKEAAN